MRLEQGPSEICIVAGQKPCGDVDDFEVSGVDLFVDGVDPREIAVRKNLLLGTPPPWPRPGVPWGQRQAWPSAAPTWPSPRASAADLLAPWLAGVARH